MLTKEQVLDAIRKGRKSECLDGRDYDRLADFLSNKDIVEVLGFELIPGIPESEPRPWTAEEVKKQLQLDVDFGFEKALNQRGLSSGMMYRVVLMWMWILEDELQHNENYKMYGLPLFKAVALKYGFPNEIGDDSGEEDKYNE